MSGYVIVDSTTEIVHSLMSWRDSDLPSDYPIDSGYYAHKLSDDIFSQTQNKYLEVYKLKVINQNGTTYEEIFEEVSKTLDEIKSDKIKELDSECTKSVLGTFPYTYSDGIVYNFSNDMEAQTNFDKVARAFDKVLITSINWTAYDSQGVVQRLSFDATTFDDLYRAHLQHIQDNISKFRDTLQPQVEAATSIDEVNAIVW